MGPDGVWVEVQIRTQRMEDIAERGFAAHWKYKHATISNDEDEFDKWLKKIRDALNSPTENAVDFLDNFKLSLYTSEIVVFTPKGESRKMPYGATALDFEMCIRDSTKVKVVKNKVAPPFKKAEFDILFGEGISKLGEIIDLGVDYGIIKKAGSWFSYGDRKIGQGRDAVKELLSRDEALRDEIEGKVREAMKTKKE